MYPDQSQASKEVNDSQAFTVGRKSFIFWTSRFQMLQGLYKVSRKYSKNWLRRT